MSKSTDYLTARQILLDKVTPVEKETIALEEGAGRVLAMNLVADANVPPFDRAAYDGYAFRSEDVADAAEEHPVTLKILEEIPAGSVGTKQVTAGTAVKILTGAPVPEGADAVINYEATEFTEEQVTVFKPVKHDANIVKTGEDVQEGQILASAGTVIDAGLLGSLASQGVVRPEVFKKPVVGIISTGSEVVEADQEAGPGKIHNSNRYTLDVALRKIGCEPKYFGIAGDRKEDIHKLIEQALGCCDAILLTGGVSVGDYDVTPDAMEMAGIKIFVRGVSIKPGMACAYGEKDGIIICGLSGNPASCITNFYAIVAPALKKLTGQANPVPEEIEMEIAEECRKKSPVTRFLRGKLSLVDGTVKMIPTKSQGNVVLSSTIGCDVMAIVPGGHGPVAAGTKLKGFLL